MMTSFKSNLLALIHQAYRDEQAFIDSLGDDERATVGAPEHWSAKDHLAHIAFWRQRLVLRLRAVLTGEPQPGFQDHLQVNKQVFEDHREHSWREVLELGERSYEAQTEHLDQVPEADLVTFGRFDWIPNTEPLCIVVMDYSYEHSQQHFAQYYVDRRNPLRGAEVFQSWADRLVSADVPPAMKGHSLYNLACFQATHGNLEKASESLDQAFAVYPGPRLIDWSKTDPELSVLRRMIRTTRLNLVPVETSDAHAALSGERRPDWASDYPTEGDVVIARLIAENSVLSADAYVPYKIALRESGQVIGGCGFLGPPDTKGSVEIGYGLAPSQRGKGIATEAVNGLVDKAWTDPLVTLVFALTEEGNEPSQGVLRRAGFRQVDSGIEQLRWEIVRPLDRLPGSD